MGTHTGQGEAHHAYLPCTGGEYIGAGGGGGGGRGGTGSGTAKVCNP